MDFFFATVKIDPIHIDLFATKVKRELQVKKGRESLVKRIAARLNLFYDNVLIDEFQDFREHDYELIMALAKQLNSVMLVGDYYQHSVSATNNSGKPFKKKKSDVGYSEFISELQSTGFKIDTQPSDLCQCIQFFFD